MVPQMRVPGLLFPPLPSIFQKVSPTPDSLWYRALVQHPLPRLQFNRNRCALRNRCPVSVHPLRSIKHLSQCNL